MHGLYNARPTVTFPAAGHCHSPWLVLFRISLMVKGGVSLSDWLHTEGMPTDGHPSQYQPGSV